MSGVREDTGRRDGDDDRGDSPLETVAAGAVIAVTLGVGFGLLALGEPLFWVAFPVGFGGGLPLAVGLARWYESRSDDAGHPHSDTDAALAELRERYARGELDDEQFETRVERLLETESVADANDFIERRPGGDEQTGDRVPENERA